MNKFIHSMGAKAATVGLVAAIFLANVGVVNAQTASSLEAQIAALQAQIAALTGASSTSITFTKDLTLGASGSDVTALQNWLITKGYRIAAGATGYFGAQTQMALASYQAANGISPAAGYFGPVTRAKINAAGSTGGSTGGGTGGTTSGGLKGGAGSIDDYTLISKLNNEEVGEDQEDREVAGIEIDVDKGSDIRLTSLRLVFDEGTATSDFEDYASEVSIFLDGDEIARVDADEFDDDNDWTKTISLDKSAIIRAGKTGELTVAVSGANNIDSADLGDTWTVDFRQVRFMDADGATVSEDPSTDARTFSFESFAAAGNVELKIAEDDDEVNEARTLEVDTSKSTDDVSVLSFTLQAKGDSDLEIKKFGVNASVTGAANTDDIIGSLSLWIDGKEVATSDSVSGGGSSHTYVFDDVDYTLKAGKTVDAEIRAEFNDIEAGTFDEGDTVSFALGENETDNGSLVEIEDESGEELVDSDITGSVTAGAFDLRSAGIKVAFISSTQSALTGNSANDDSGTFVIKYSVTAFGNDVYVSDSAAATLASTISDETISPNGVLYMLDKAGVATTADTSAVVTFSGKSGVSDAGVVNGVKIKEGKTATFTLTIVRANNGDADDNGLFRASLKTIGWATTDTSTWNVYDFNLEDYKTDLLFLN